MLIRRCLSRMGVFILGVILSLPGDGAAQRPARPTPTLAAFDTARATVPATFRGVDLSVLATRLARPSKGEFETTEAWTERIRTRRAGVMNRFYALWYDPARCDGEEVWKYDADAQVAALHVAVSYRSPFWLGDSLATTPTFVPTNCTTKPVRIVNGMTRMGVRFPYRVLEGSQWGLLLPGDRYSYDEYTDTERELYGPIWLRLQMSTDSARTLRPALKYLLVFALDSIDSGQMLTAVATDSRTASLDRPSQVTVSMKAVTIAYAELWLINGRNGTVVARLAIPTN